MMKNFLYSLFFFSIIAYSFAKEIPKDEVKMENEVSSTLVVTTSTAANIIESSSASQVTVKEEEEEEAPSSTQQVLSTTTTEKIDELEESQENNLPHPEEQQQPQHQQQQQRRKVLYVNQQQSGKFNVHLELNDVSLIVIPNKKDPQLSLLNLLLRSAQKSNLKKNENQHAQLNEGGNNKMGGAGGDEESRKIENNVHKTSDEYSKYKMESFMHSSTNEPFPAIESRVAPYKVDISSTLGQPSPVEIIPNANLMARSPSVKVLKPSNSRIFKRSIDTRFYDGLNFDSPVLSDHSISSNDKDEDELTESITNSLENNENVNTIGDADDSFVLLGAVENCGPGRRRNSYQICVNDTE